VETFLVGDVDAVVDVADAVDADAVVVVVVVAVVVVGRRPRHELQRELLRDGMEACWPKEDSEAFFISPLVFVSQN
jgi:hypothetical protein